MSSSRRNHLYHLVEPSPWPFFVSLCSFSFASSMVFSFHRIEGGWFLFFLSLLLLLACAGFWFRDIILEATYLGQHTLVVKMGLKKGFFMFILSEIMLFFGFFWAFFHSALSPSIVLNGVWPPAGIKPIFPYFYPLFNTLLLITSGFAVTWAHRAFALRSYKEAMDSFLLTLLLGFIFILCQGVEYYESTFNFSDSIYACTFYMLTGLHGMHVFVGAVFILVCFLRLLRKHFTYRHYLGFVCAIWYWHFVDVVWIVLFLSLYCWGSW